MLSLADWPKDPHVKCGAFSKRHSWRRPTNK